MKYTSYIKHAHTHTHARTVTLNKTLIFFFPKRFFFFFRDNPLLATFDAASLAGLEEDGVGWGGDRGEGRQGWVRGVLGRVGMANGIMTGRATVAFLNGEAT